MATEKQKKAFKEVTENHRSVSGAMKVAGYSSSSATKPSNLTDSNGWREMMDKNFPDKFLAKVHKEGLKATKKENEIVGRDGKGQPEYALVDVEDYATRHRYLDSAYKLKGKYAAEKKEVSIPPEEMNILKEVLGSLRE